ncbi:unnamed protein product, partial [Prorocentrum cordatum]
AMRGREAHRSRESAARPLLFCDAWWEHHAHAVVRFLRWILGESKDISTGKGHPGWQQGSIKGDDGKCMEAGKHRGNRIGRAGGKGHVLMGGRERYKRRQNGRAAADCTEGATKVRQASNEQGMVGEAGGKQEFPRQGLFREAYSTRPLKLQWANSTSTAEVLEGSRGALCAGGRAGRQMHDRAAAASNVARATQLTTMLPPAASALAK